MNTIKNIAITILALFAVWSFFLEDRVNQWLRDREEARIAATAAKGNEILDETLKAKKDSDTAAGVDCSPIDVNLLKDDKSRTDGGTRPNASVTAKIEAADGYFLSGSSLEYANTGTRSANGTKLVRLPIEKLKGSTLEYTLLKGAEFTVWCKGSWNPAGTSSCTATASITGQQYPIACAKMITDRELKSVVDNL